MIHYNRFLIQFGATFCTNKSSMGMNMALDTTKIAPPIEYIEGMTSKAKDCKMKAKIIS